MKPNSNTAQGWRQYFDADDWQLPAAIEGLVTSGLLIDTTPPSCRMPRFSRQFGNMRLTVFVQHADIARRSPKNPSRFGVVECACTDEGLPLSSENYTTLYEGDDLNDALFTLHGAINRLAALENNKHAARIQC